MVLRKIVYIKADTQYCLIIFTCTCRLYDEFSVHVIMNETCCLVDNRVDSCIDHEACLLMAY